jgi:hypothetical protein
MTYEKITADQIKQNLPLSDADWWPVSCLSRLEPVQVARTTACEKTSRIVWRAVFTTATIKLKSKKSVRQLPQCTSRQQHACEDHWSTVVSSILAFLTSHDDESQ